MVCCRCVTIFLCYILYQIMSYYVIHRELDFDVFNMLKVGLITKSALDTNMNTKVMSLSAVSSIRTVWCTLIGDCHKLLYCCDMMKTVSLLACCICHSGIKCEFWLSDLFECKYECHKPINMQLRQKRETGSKVQVALCGNKSTLR